MTVRINALLHELITFNSLSIMPGNPTSSTFDRER